MPGRRSFAIDERFCRRCQEDEPATTVRTEPLCGACLVKYVGTKVVKRMESFRVRHSDPGNERTLLLPWSCGAGSTVLLHVLSQHRKGQVERTGRTGFNIHVCHVHPPGEEAALTLLDQLQARYPEHAYSAFPLDDVLGVGGARDLFPSLAGEAETNLTPNDLASALSSLDSSTSRADARYILIRRLVVAKAKALDCEAILWGDSTTKLAEKTLSATAKGRGSTLPWIGADGQSLHGLPFYYPMRDLLTKEISSFASLVVPPIDDLLLPKGLRPAVSTRSTTIDDLMKQYFESVEQEYPSIVANVVKTSGKLKAQTLALVEMQCEMCDAPLDGQAPESSRLCHGCVRTLMAG